MKKYKNLFITFLILMVMILPQKANAASGYYSINSNSSVTEGSNIKVTFTMKSKNIFYWQAYITYDTSRLKLISGSTSFKGDVGTGSGKNSISQTLTFTAKKAGNAWIKISPDSNGDYNINTNGERISLSPKSKTITIKEKAIKTYSSNNYLKNLSIDNYKLTPEFNKNTLEYNVELPVNTTEIKINASKEDNTASISGTGIQKVSEGANKLLVKVTAENGNIKEYIINATVKELEPIEVTIDNQKLSVIRKKEQLPKANSTYEETTIKINDEDVPALKSDITKYILVGLKSESGIIGLYIYNEEDNSYTPYNEMTFNKLTVIPLNEDSSIKIPSKYKKAVITINNQNINGYKYNNSYPIFIGMNVETGEKNLYSYDENENTIQRFNQETESTKANNDDNMYTYIITLLGGFLTLTYLVILINLIKKNKKQKKLELNYKK